MSIEIPLIAYPEQIFVITLNAERYEMRVLYNTRSAYWAIDISQNGTPLLFGVPILGGTDILKQHTIAIKNLFVINVDNDNVDATVDNLGDVVKLILLSDQEVIDVKTIQ